MRRMCVDCEKRPVCAEQRRNGGSLCEQCLEWAGWENEHSDNCHDEINAGEDMSISAEKIAEIREFSMANCPICLEYPHPRDTFKAGHTNTQAKTYTSHADCDHPRTPKAREICRRARRAAGVPAKPKGRRLPTSGSMDSPVVEVDRQRRKGASLLMSADEIARARKGGHNV